MFSNIIVRSTSDKEYNEDGYGFRKDLVFVIDGATGLGENNYMGYGDDAKWFVDGVCEYLQKYLSSQPLETCLSKVCSLLYSEYSKIVKDVNSSSMPSSCISLFREIDDEIEFFGLGDTVGVCEFVDGTYEVLFDQRLVDLDSVAIDEMVTISKERGISPIEARKYIQSTLIKHRSLVNTEEGYYSLDVTGKGLSKAIKRRWKKDVIKRICCMSDGFYEVMEFGLYQDIPSLLDAIEANVDEVLANLCKAQDDDSLGYKVPRFKLRDDITVVYTKRKEA